MSMNVGGKKGGPVAEINVTPMADIMIVLLIIFMVITPLLQKGVDVVLPKAAYSKEKLDKKDTVVVAVRKDLSLYLGAKPQTGGAAELEPKLREMIEALPDAEKTVYLKADVELPYADVMNVMEMCRKAGAEEVALIAEKKAQS